MIKEFEINFLPNNIMHINNYIFMTVPNKYY